MNSKNVEILAGAVVLVIFIVVASCFMVNVFNKHNYVINSLEITLGQDAKKINQSGLYSTDDASGKKLEPYTFTVNNNSGSTSAYKVLIEDSSASNKKTYKEEELLSRHYLRYQLLVNDKEIAVKNMEDIKNNVIDTRTMPGHATNSYKLRIWVRDDITDTGWMNKYYHYNIVIQPIES
jgi:hypothetical protein